MKKLEIIKTLILNNYYEIESNRNFGNKDNFSTGRTENGKIIKLYFKRNIKNYYGYDHNQCDIFRDRMLQVE